MLKMNSLFDSIINEIAKSENISEKKLNVLKLALEIASKVEEKEGVNDEFGFEETQDSCSIIIRTYHYIPILSFLCESTPRPREHFDVKILAEKSNYPNKIILSHFDEGSCKDSEKDTEIKFYWYDDESAIKAAANHLNKCPSNPEYEALTDEEIIAELKKFKYGENELTPLQFAYLYLLPNIVEETLNHSKSLKKISYNDGYDEETYIQIFRDFLNYFNSFLKYGSSYSFNKTDYQYFYPYQEDTEIDAASIAKFLELFIPYYEQVSRAVISAGEQYVNEIDSMSIYDDDDYNNKPDWLGGMETEDEFWEHE